MKINCDKCGKVLDKPGALVFSPPSNNALVGQSTLKFHFCVGCWDLHLKPMVSTFRLRTIEEDDVEEDNHIGI